jgi:hypothetical protein
MGDKRAFEINIYLNFMTNFPNQREKEYIAPLELNKNDLNLILRAYRCPAAIKSME